MSILMPGMSLDNQRVEVQPKSVFITLKLLESPMNQHLIVEFYAILCCFIIFIKISNGIEQLRKLNTLYFVK